MSVNGISGSNALLSLIAQGGNQQSGQNKFQKVQSEFQQLGQDLQSGNLTQAQSDFATIEQDARQQGSAVAQHHHRHHGQFGQEINTLQQDFGTLGQALQSGNIASAQQAYATFQSALQQDFPGVASSLRSAETASATTSTNNIVNVTA